uniref:Uncharacterized protein n=1 Tax=Plectus sambesii TaxID=2011161 RepID=A0A914VEH8_9BILA
MKSESRASSDDVLADFSDHTTAHGFGNVMRSDSWLGKGIWIVALLIAWAVCCYQLADSITTYLKYPTTTSVTLTHSSDVPFPAVTICNLNSIRFYQMAGDSKQVGSSYSDMANNLMMAKPSAVPWDDFDMSGSREATGEYGYAATASTKFDNMEIVTECGYRMSHLRDVYNYNLDVSSAGHQIGDMLLDCSFQGRQCLPKNFTKWQHGSYGNCYTIIIDAGTYPSFVGPDYGLSLTLFTEEEEYLPMITPAAGFRVELHSPSYVPFPEDLGFTISPGFLTSAAVQQRVITRQPLPYDGTDCGLNLRKQNKIPLPNVYESWLDVLKSNPSNYLTMNYTNQACMKSCYQIKLAEYCHCINPAYVTRSQMERVYGESSVPLACDQSSYNVSCCVFEFTENIDSECETMCYQPCMEEDYDARITTSLWPRAKYFNTSQAAWAKRNALINNMTAQEARDKIAKLEVYYRVLNREMITESVAIKIFDLLTSVGGTLGLYGGLSFLTILEFVECCALYCSSKRKHRINQTSRVASTDTISSTLGDIPSTMRYPVKTNGD